MAVARRSTQGGCCRGRQVICPDADGARYLPPSQSDPPGGVTLLDTGPIAALIDDLDGQHRAAARALSGVPGKASTTWAVVSEALHLLGRRHGWQTQGHLARLVRTGRLEVADLTAVLGDRSLELMAEYHDAEMDFADASLVALAEARRDYRIVTFDSDFRFYRVAAG
jgi:predicted nucleic acid-binding protein